MTNSTRFHVRQGDVLIRKIDALPAAAKKTKDNILAYGEVTGHAHSVHGATMYKVADTPVFVVADEAEIRHQEHSTIMLPAGIYESVRQREYSPEAIRMVGD